MPEVVIPSGYGLAKFTWTMTGKTNPISSTCGYFGGETPPVDCAQAIYEYAINDGSICDSFAMSSTYTFVGVEVQQMVDTTLEGAAYGTPITGSFTVALPPINGTLLMSKKTARVGRQYQGRMYLPNSHVAENLIDPMGNLDSTTFTAFQGRVNIFAVGPTDDDGFLTTTVPHAVILHTDPLLDPTAITAFIAKPQLATQRRRMRS